MSVMDTPTLLKLCRANQLYSTPELNDKLYLHYKGFKRIESLQPYTGLKCLYLEGNSLHRIEGLECAQELKCLYLQENAIDDMSSGLETLTQLSTLNLSQNRLSAITGLAACQQLSTLTLSGNCLCDVQKLTGLLEIRQSLSVLDLTKNQLSDGQSLLNDILSQLTQLRVLYLKDNPLVQTLPHYRRAIIAACPSLTYLDDRPVFDSERRCTLAWLKGGAEAERQEHATIAREKRDEEERQFTQFGEMLRQAREARRANGGGGGALTPAEAIEDAQDDDEDAESEHSATETTSDESELDSDATPRSAAAAAARRQSALDSSEASGSDLTSGDEHESSVVREANQELAAAISQIEQAVPLTPTADQSATPAVVAPITVTSADLPLSSSARSLSSIGTEHAPYQYRRADVMPVAPVTYTHTDTVDPLLLERRLNRDDVLVAGDSMSDAIASIADDESASIIPQLESMTLAEESLSNVAPIVRAPAPRTTEAWSESSLVSDAPGTGSDALRLAALLANAESGTLDEDQAANESTPVAQGSVFSEID